MTMIRINEGKAIEKYLTHMLNKYSSDKDDLFDNYLYFYHLLNKSLSLLEDVIDYVETTKLESVVFKTKHERLIMENYYFCQDMKELYELVEQQYFTLKTYGIMKGEDDNDTD